MGSGKNVLILKGDIAAGHMLDLLQELMVVIQKRNELGDTPEPWQLFSLICGSGNLREARFRPSLCRC